MRGSLGAACLAAVFVASGSAYGDVIKRTLDPAVSPDGKTVAFTYQGDIWTVGIEGGEARRLTVHASDDGMPHWSPDGKTIVFNSNRFGSLDVFSMRADGTGLKRLTYDSSAEYPTGVTADGAVYGYTSQWGRLDVFRVGAGGGDLIRLTGHPLEMEYYPAPNAAGTKVLFNTAGSASHWRKPGQSGANTAEVWFADAGVPLSNMRQLTKNESSDLFPVWLDDDTALILSNPTGCFNLQTLDVRSGKQAMVTSFTSGTMRSLSTGGGVAVYQRESTIWVTDLKTKQSRELVVSAPADARRNPVQEFRLTTGVEDADVSPNGKLAVIQVRGDLFLLPAGGGTTRQLTTSVRPDSNPQWLDDDKLVFQATEVGGKKVLMTLTKDGKSSVFHSEAMDCMNPVLSPDKKWLAFHRGNREICVMPAGGGSPVVVAEGEFSGAYQGGISFSWTPDSAWLATDVQGERSVGLYLVSRDGQKRIEVTRAGKSASTPVVSADGKFFLYSGIEGNDYSEIRNSRSSGFIVDLVPQTVTFDEDDLDKMDQKPDEAEAVKVEVREKGLKDRKRKLAGEVTGAWPAAKGSVFYVNFDGQFSRLDGKTGRATPVAGVTGSVQGAMEKGGKLYVIQRGVVSIVGPQGPVPVRFEAASRVDMAAEELALFEAAWWSLDRMYYDSGMHGKDWAGIKKQFGELVPYCTDRDDFYQLMGEMVERLDSSHQGSTSSAPYQPTDRETTGWLGVEWDHARVAAGSYVVAKVYAGTPADNPSTELMVGDKVLTVNGVKPGAGSPMAELFRGTAGKKVILSVERGGKTMEVAIKPTSLAVESGAAYDDWVTWNKKEVDRLSGGKLGYIHIQGMDEPSLDTFLTEIATELEGKKGVVVDVRYNGGGYTSHIILNIMRKVPWLIRTERALPGVKYSENQYRGNALELPAACLTNEYSFSNAEIFSEGFKRLKLGPIVGERTGGGVIGTSAVRLWDGGSIRLPASGAYTVDMVNLERDGRRPDFDVPFDPVAWMTQGRDTQLEKAVAELMKKL